MNRHGTIDFHWEGCRLVTHAKGPFNLESVHYYFDKIAQTVDENRHTYWNRLEIWDMEALGSPEVTEQVREMYQTLFLRGCQNTATVVSNELQTVLVERLSIYGAKSFKSIKDAEVWLEEVSLPHK